jgi:hypothetical protein
MLSTSERDSRFEMEIWVVTSQGQGRTVLVGSTTGSLDLGLEATLQAAELAGLGSCPGRALTLLCGRWICF